jgi:hypothetical protein
MLQVDKPEVSLQIGGAIKKGHFSLVLLCLCALLYIQIRTGWDYVRSAPWLGLLLTTVASAIIRPWRMSKTALWASTLFYAVGAATSMGFAISGSRASGDMLPEMGERVLNKADVTSLLKREGVDIEKTRFVATGIHVSGYEFASAQNVNVQGYVWQRYPAGTPKTLLRGVIFPEALDGGLESQEIYRVTKPDGSEAVCWQFNVTLRQKFGYEKYPFDKQDLWIRMWHRDFEEGAILVPDFGGYPTWESGAKLGLEPEIVLSGFKNIYSNWSYAKHNYRAAWGFGDYEEKRPFPELYYSVTLLREPLSAIIIHVLPILTVYLLTFAVVLFMVKDDERSFNIIGVLSGFFFVTLLNHQQIRIVANAAGLSFLGYASVVLYISFFAIAINSLLLAKLDVPWIEYSNNLMAKLLFLPATLWPMVFVTDFIMRG